MYIVYIQQVVKVLKNIYVINYKSNDHPLVNSLLGRIIDRFFFFGSFFVLLCVHVCVRVGLCFCVYARGCTCMCVCARVRACVCVLHVVASSVSDTQNAYLILFSSIQLFVLLYSRCFSMKRLSLFNCAWRSYHVCSLPH